MSWLSTNVRAAATLSVVFLLLATLPNQNSLSVFVSADTAANGAGSILISVITPEHNTKNAETFLVELYDSLVQQTFQNWEWVLYLTGECEKKHIPTAIANDERVRMFEVGNVHAGSIGGIKNAAFLLGKGEYLLEVDHDDILEPDCLLEVHKAFEADNECGFVSTDDATYHMEDKFVPFNAAYGWNHSVYEWKRAGGKLDIVHMHSFSPSSHSVGLIWYAPDHIRAWRRDLYHEIGGHNAELSVCDDHELMIRTYLKSKFCHVHIPLYIYRITGNNSWLQRNADIQSTTVKLFHQYGQQLAERDADLNGLLKIDLGGGINPRAGYKTIDLHDAEIIADLNDGIPLPDNSVGVIYAHHILQHLKDPVKTMSEIYRVLAHGGWVFVQVPSTDGRGAFQDPSHISYWNENSFFYYTNKQFGRFLKHKGIRFQNYRLETRYPSKWFEDMKIPVVDAWLVALKNDSRRFPGLAEI